MEDPFFLELEINKISLNEAEKIVEKTLRIIGQRFEDKKNGKLTITDDKTSKDYKYSELIKITREAGFCVPIQNHIDRNDNVFGRSFGISTPNWHFKTTTKWATFEKELQGPFRNHPVEMEISNDITFYREETCIESNNHDFEMSYRNYRAYLFSCISLVDAYINKSIIAHDFLTQDKSEDFEELKKSLNTEKSIELFLKVFTSKNIADIKKTREWSDFKKLKDLRNEIVHALHPFLGINIKDIAENLNLSKKGIGGLLRLFQEWQNKPSLSFIEQVRIAPLAYYNQITLRGDGNHQIKRIFSKR